MSGELYVQLLQTLAARQQRLGSTIRPAGEYQIKRAQDVLDVQFPTSYILFLQHVGCGAQLSSDIYGLDGADQPREGWPDSVILNTLLWRSQSKMADKGDYFAVTEDYCTHYYIMKTARKTSSEMDGVVYYWDKDYVHDLYPSFADFVRAYAIRANVEIPSDRP